MDPELAKEIEETVISVLKSSDMESTTEFQIRKSSSELLGIDLSEPTRKQHVRDIVQTYLEQQQSKADNENDGKEKPVGDDDKPVGEDDEPEQVVEEESEEEDEEEKKKGGGKKEFDDEGDLIICRLSDKRRVTLTEFRGKSLVSIREYYKKDGKELPSSKGISLTAEQWSNFSKNVTAIEKAIKKMEGRL